MDETSLSANEIEMLILKAARGGGLPLGHAEDLSKAAAFLDLDALTTCPCSGQTVAAIDLPLALDRVLAGLGPQTVQAERQLAAAYCAVVAAQSGFQIETANTDDGTRVKLTLSDSDAGQRVPKGRRSIDSALADHLAEMSSRILVPETAASRAAGAGAGLTDND